jgi:hypothetical protein
MRSAASCCHPLHEISVPRGARNGPLLNPSSATVFTVLIAISPSTPHSASYQLSYSSGGNAAVLFPVSAPLCRSRCEPDCGVKVEK